MGLTQIVFTLNIDEESGLFTCDCLGIENQTRSLETAVDETVTGLLAAHDALQGIADEMLSLDGIALRDTLMNY